MLVFMLCLLTLIGSTCLHGVSCKRVLVEMSHVYNQSTVGPLGDQMWKYEHVNVHRGRWAGHGDIWFEINNFKMNEHSGTHVDSPTHFSRGGWDPAEIPIDKLYRIPAAVIDITEKVKQNNRAQLEPADLEAWESKYGMLPDNAAVLVNSGWSVKYGTPEYLAIKRDRNGTIIEHTFPSISPAAAQWLVDNRPSIACVGIDTTSIESEPNYNYTSHRILLGKSVYAVENVKDPQRMPASGGMITILPIRIQDGSGAAARIVGEYTSGEDDSKSGAAFIGDQALSLTLAAMFLVYVQDS